MRATDIARSRNTTAHHRCASPEPRLCSSFAEQLQILSPFATNVKTRIHHRFHIIPLREKPFIRLWETKLLPPRIIEFSTIYYRTTNKRITTLLSHVRSLLIGKSIETDFSLRWTEEFSIISRSICNSGSLISNARWSVTRIDTHNNSRWSVSWHADNMLLKNAATRNLANSYYPKMTIR